MIIVIGSIIVLASVLCGFSMGGGSVSASLRERDSDGIAVAVVALREVRA